MTPQPNPTSKPMTLEEQIMEQFDKKFEFANENPALIGKGDAKVFILSAINQARQETAKDILTMVESQRDVYHGGGNGRRLFIQLEGSIRAKYLK